ncbi:hypothetical protein FEM48_ZijujUnG0075800 [Ziziphus jujuba var. spinosa]|uniref:Uncharacterized protein n=1 Tax=Ziziphus jujuba var. spinosa TaxID=714518 RepID=A0A978U8S5_ZIZJJ|nr:hypothetical protein FEM48_ZijujUnG0075800 [Ziziphus jujuba var. spinosa]
MAIIGNLPLLQGPQPPHITFGNLVDKYRPNLHHQVSNWEMAKVCLTTNDKVFFNPPKLVAPDLMGNNYAMFRFSLYGSYWRQMRNIATFEVLSHHRIDMLGHIRESDTDGFKPPPLPPTSKLRFKTDGFKPSRLPAPAAASKLRGLTSTASAVNFVKNPAPVPSSKLTGLTLSPHLLLIFFQNPAPVPSSKLTGLTLSQHLLLIFFPEPNTSCCLAASKITGLTLTGLTALLLNFIQLILSRDDTLAAVM